MIFNEILQDLIIENGNKSLRYIAREIGIGQSQLSKFLRGSLPEPKTAIQLANYFKCSLDYLFGFSTEFKELSSPLILDKTGFYPKYYDLLQKHNISHFKLSQKIDICETSLRLWKRGVLPQTLAIIEIADYFDCSIDFLLCKK